MNITSGSCSFDSNGDDIEKAVPMDGNNHISQDLPFIVTHWLDNYRSSNGINEDTETSTAITAVQTMLHQEAMAKIHKATSDLASAFATIGAFGTTFRPSLESSSSYLHQPVFQNRTFSDLNRMYSGLSPSHLEHLAQSVAFNNITADTTAIEDAHTNYIIRANSTGESFRNKQSSTNSSKVGGKSVQEAIILDNADDDETNNVRVDTGQSSILHKPTLIGSIQQQQHRQRLITGDVLGGSNTNSNGNTNINTNNEGTTMVHTEAERKSDQPPSIGIKATHWDVAHRTAETMRGFLTLREKVRSIDNEIRSLEASMALQQNNSNKLNRIINDIGESTIMTSIEKIEKTEQCKVSQQESGRVICQLQRKLSELIRNQNSRKSELIYLKTKTQNLDKKRRNIVHSFRDPFTSWKGDLAKGSRVGGCVTLQSIVGREQGLSRGRLSRYQSRSSLSTGQNPVHFLELRKNLLSTRLSHAITINTHMNCPVYCLRFDRTGRYFITGADDFLLKVFHLGAARSCKTQNTTGRSQQLQLNYGANFRGAVLVCTLRGHAGVINDIDVSLDNCLLATASDDGDVRVWGLKNGCPVAILRGHKGGANMVSWSALTPYRLVSTGSDGFARVWDIREACLKRYSNIVCQREEYNILLTKEEKKAQMDGQKVTDKATGSAQRKPLSSTTDMDNNALPDIVVAPTAADASSEPADSRGVEPGSENNSSTTTTNNNNNSGNNAPDVDIIVPPLPAAVPPLGQGADSGNQEPAAQDENASGQFVANDLIDEGVKLLSKYQHGEIQEEHHGPGTRSRRLAINVICVARCPLGKQFVTGSDDGICRVWEDFDDSSVAIIDGRLSDNDSNLDMFLNCAMPLRSGIEKKPLLKLMGHVSTITDLSYSHTGGRILSASQKDGVVRLWNVGIGFGNKNVFKEKRVTQIVIKLTNPFLKKPLQPIRRRPGSAGRNASSKVCCDVAVWTRDDFYVITSQCVLVKENAKPIQPGSQFLCLWDSKSGQCLIGISGAHTLTCQVVIPHPMDASIFCTGSIDGTAKVWDLSQGKCIFTHRNKVEFGPPDQYKPNFAGYLDGSFSPDGSVIILTDECGQITVLDSILKEDNPPNTGNALKWMREQYFANDYYDLAYDRNGYCIEKGSKRPPHLAPKSARCTHNGAPWSDDINETYKKLTGPSPLPENSCKWHREEIRAKRLSRGRSTSFSPEQGPSVRVSVREFDPLSTIIIRGVDHTGDESSNQRRRNTSTFGASGHSQGGEMNESTTSTIRRLESANYRYLDYDDLIRREGNPEDDEPDSDDEEFEPVANRRTRVVNGNVESEDDDDDDNFSVNSQNNHRRSRQRNHASSRTTEERRVRAQRRAQRNTSTDFVEIGSDDELTAQYISINKTATGPYLRDYTLNGHYWQLKSRSDVVRVRRKWIQRKDSDSSYFGRQVFTPQMGDSIVYIPRAHFETIKECPSLSPPWQSWPRGACWPVVRCFVRGIRYRFPYEDYFRNKQQTKCSSIVAILTLEVTGIPELSEDREFPWPRPSFIEPTRPFVFELSVFENTSCEYIISDTLYSSRISSLENHIRLRSEGVSGLEVDLYYEQERRGEDLELQAWPSIIEDLLPDERHSDAHLQGSGYGVVQVWDGKEENRDFVSPWELNTDGADLARPCMTEEEKESILQELNRLLRKDKIAHHLSMPVDQERYFDYANMVEIPMDMMIVKRRLTANYYGSKLGVAADLRLIRDNCIKYNTTENEMSEIASTMCNEFEDNVLSEDERSQMISEEDFDKIHNEQSQGRQTSRMRIQLSARRVQEASQAAASSGGRYTLRNRMGASSLENLPAPENNYSTQRRQSLREVNIATAVAREPQNSRSRGRNNETEVLGQISRQHSISSRRRDASNVDTSVDTEVADARSARARSRTQRNEDGFSNVVSRTSSRRNPLPESLGRGHRSSTRARNSLGQNNRRGSHQPSGDNHDSNDDRSEDEAANRTRTTRRSSRGALSSRSQEFQEDENSEEDVAEGRSRRSTRRISSRVLEEEMDDVDYHEDENSEDGVAKGPVSRNRARRSTVRTTSRALVEKGDDESDEEFPESEQNVEMSDAESQYSDDNNECSSSVGSDFEGQKLPPPASKRRQTSPRSTKPPGRRSNRKARSQRKTYEEVESDEERYASDSENSKGRRSNRKAGTQRKTYEEVESNEERCASDSENFKGADVYPKVESDNEERDEEEEEASLPKRAASKRKRQTRSVATSSSKNKKAKKGSMELPELKPWPDIEVRDITMVASEVLRRISDNDELDTFAKPVFEAHPAITDVYLSVIENPIDLRTIREERIHYYNSIHMLQEDLVLMFRNCCTFNAPNTEFWIMAKVLWEDLNQNFIDSCQALGILLPRRWKS